MIKITKSFFIICFALLIISPALASDDKSKTQRGAETFVNTMATTAIGFLSNDALSKNQKEASFRALLKKSFDLDTIGRFVLGRYWRTASAEQRKQYVALFKEMVVDVYVARFEEYSGQTIEVYDSRKDSEKDYTVKTKVLGDANGPGIDVDWRVRYKNGRYTIVDVVVEGVSMALTQRSEFASVIQRGGGDVSVLITHLEE